VAKTAPRPITLAKAQRDYSKHLSRGASAREAVSVPAIVPLGQKAFGEARVGDGANGARKMDVGKAPVVCGFIAYFPRAMNAVALVSEYGARKYNDGEYKTDWQKVPNGFNRYSDGIGRHMTKAAIERYDDESQIAHLAHLAWNAMAALEIALKDGVNGTPVEMRQGNQVVNGAPVLGTFKEVRL
jgi:hypothetical protein